MWTIGQVERKTVYLQSKKLNAKGKPIVFPVHLCRLPLHFICKDGTKVTWTIGMYRGKFSIIYPNTVEDRDKWGFYRPNGTREVQHRDSGLDAELLVQRLYAKFPPKFVREIVVAMNRD